MVGKWLIASGYWLFSKYTYQFSNKILNNEK